MKFDTLKEKCEYFRSLTDYRLTPNSYVIAFLDGRSFSKLIKNKYEKPFDNTFISMMNETAKYLLKNIQGAKFAYVQSDEISILISDFDTPETDAFFGYRLCKMQSIMASMAASKFNQLAITNDIKSRCYGTTQTDCEDTLYTLKDAVQYLEKAKLVEFDCKCWTVPSPNDAYCHFLWRQNDCIRNSKQQAAQTYLSHKELIGKHTDEQIALLKAEKGIDWNDYSDGEKYGRLIYKEEETLSTTVPKKNSNGVIDWMPIEYKRNVFKPHGALPFGAENNIIHSLIPSRISIKTAESVEN